MNARRWRVGVIGAGEVAKRYHLPILRAMNDVDVRWICDVDIDKARAAARGSGVPAAHASLDECEPVEVALVAIPLGERRDLIKQVLARGWHALVEKPIARTLADHADLMASADARGVQIGVGLMRRFHQNVIAAEQVVAAGLLGPIHAVWAGEVSQLRRTGRGRDWYQADAARAGGGVLLETGSHLVDTTARILGVERFVEVKAALLEYRGVDVETHVRARATTAHGGDVPVAFRLTRLRDVYSGIVVEGVHGCLHVPIPAEEELSWLDPGGRRIAELHLPVAGARNAFQAFFLEWVAFLEQCATGEPGRADARAHGVGVELVESAYTASLHPELS